MTPLFIHVHITTSDGLVYYLNIYLNDGYGQLPSLIHIPTSLSRRLNMKFKIRTVSSLQQRCSPSSLQQRCSSSSLQQRCSPSSLQQRYSPSSLQQRCSPSYVSVGILLTVENTCLYQVRKKRSYTYAKWMDFASVSNGPHRWRNGWRARLEFVRSWVRVPVG